MAELYLPNKAKTKVVVPDSWSQEQVQHYAQKVVENNYQPLPTGVFFANEPVQKDRMLGEHMGRTAGDAITRGVAHLPSSAAGLATALFDIPAAVWNAGRQHKTVVETDWKKAWEDSPKVSDWSPSLTPEAIDAGMLKNQAHGDPQKMLYSPTPPSDMVGRYTAAATEGIPAGILGGLPGVVGSSLGGVGQRVGQDIAPDSKYVGPMLGLASGSVAGLSTQGMMRPRPNIWPTRAGLTAKEATLSADEMYKYRDVLNDTTPGSPAAPPNSPELKALSQQNSRMKRLDPILAQTPDTLNPESVMKALQNMKDNMGMTEVEQAHAQNLITPEIGRTETGIMNRVKALKDKPATKAAYAFANGVAKEKLGVDLHTGTGMLGDVLGDAVLGHKGSFSFLRSIYGIGKALAEHTAEAGKVTKAPAALHKGLTQLMDVMRTQKAYPKTGLLHRFPAKTTLRRQGILNAAVLGNTAAPIPGQGE